MKEEVKIYTTPTCPSCQKAKNYLTEKGVEFTAFDVSQDKEALKEMIEISKSRSVPVISVCSEAMIDFDQNRLEQMLGCLENRTEV